MCSRRTAYTTISPAQGLIRLWYCHRPHPHLSRTVRTPIPAAQFPRSPPASPFLRRMPPVIPSPPITYPSYPPDTPEASHLASTSLASSVSPQTPPDAHGRGLVKIATIPSFTARVTLPSKDAPVIPSPPITNPSSPPIPQGLSFNLDLSCVVGFSSNTSRCAWAWTRQGRLGRIEPCGCSGYPPWSRNHFNVCETQGPSHR